MEIMSKVKKIIAEQLGVDESEIRSESHFVDDLGATTCTGSSSFGTGPIG